MGGGSWPRGVHNSTMGRLLWAVCRVMHGRLRRSAQHVGGVSHWFGLFERVVATYSSERPRAGLWSLVCLWRGLSDRRSGDGAVFGGDRLVGDFEAAATLA
jgi:hypothetical protein